MNRQQRQLNSQSKSPIIIHEEMAQIVISNQRLVMSTDSLGQLFSQPFKPKMAFRLQKIYKQVFTLCEIIDMESKRLREKYGEYSEEYKKTVYTNANQIEYDKEFAELMSRQVEIKGVRIIKSEELGNAMVSAELLNQLDWLIVE